jgi:hypothetical protein
MVSEVLKYVAEEISYSVTVLGLSFDIFTERCNMAEFNKTGRGTIWRHFDTAEF